MMLGAETQNHDVLAQEWFYGFVPRPDMSIEVEHKLHDMRIYGTNCGSTKYGAIPKASFDYDIYSSTPNYSTKQRRKT